MKANVALAPGWYRCWRIPSLALSVVLSMLTVGLNGAGPVPAPYTAVEVDRFVPQRGVAFPTDYQSALADDIAREITVEFPTVTIVRQGDTGPNGLVILRISGTVTEFKPGNVNKRPIIGFGAGAAVIRAQVRLSDATTGQGLLNREIKGTSWTGIAGGDSQGAGESLARKIVKVCNAAHWVESH